MDVAFKLFSNISFSWMFWNDSITLSFTIIQQVWKKVTEKPYGPGAFKLFNAWKSFSSSNDLSNLAVVLASIELKDNPSSLGL